MKNLWLSVLFGLLTLQLSLKSNAQTPDENLKKYWNYRGKFQKHFVRIGNAPGNSINFANIDSDGSFLLSL